MILDCPACGAALVFDPVTGKMMCESCGNLYETYELSEDYEKRGQKETEYGGDAKKVLSEDGDTMEVNIYSCTACGAEIMVNDVEVSTFCSYCGQPTLVFSRLESARRPRYIIPFKVTKAQAISIIKDNFADGFFVPDDIKNVEMKRVRGIYIPYFLYDIHYEDTAYLLGTVGTAQNSKAICYYRKAECDFDKLAFDASVRLDDTVSRKLNPFYPGYLKDFSMEYLSGYYADFHDANEDKIRARAILRAKSTFENELIRCVAANNVRILKNYPKFEMTGIHYALYPAWFATFVNDGKPYTLIINGQTEKLVGSVPYNKEKVKKTILILWLLLTIILWCILYPWFLFLKNPISIHYLTGLIMMAPGIKFGFKNFYDIKKNTKLTALKQTDRYVKERQEG